MNDTTVEKGKSPNGRHRKFAIALLLAPLVAGFFIFLAGTGGEDQPDTLAFESSAFVGAVNAAEQAIETAEQVAVGSGVSAGQAGGSGAVVTGNNAAQLSASVAAIELGSDQRLANLREIFEEEGVESFEEPLVPTDESVADDPADTPDDELEEEIDDEVVDDVVAITPIEEPDDATRQRR